MEVPTLLTGMYNVPKQPHINYVLENLRAHPSLYDIFLVKDKDHNVRREAWQEIGDALNTPSKYYIIILIGPI